MKKTRVVIRDNATEQAVELIADLPEGDVQFVNQLGERVAQETGWDVTLLAVEAEA